MMRLEIDAEDNPKNRIISSISNLEPEKCLGSFGAPLCSVEIQVLTVILSPPSMWNASAFP